jgi:tRNA(Ile)-lysidine synthase
MKRQAKPAVPDLDPEALFRELSGAAGLILAVSGGPDSTALMVLAARWGGRPPILVVSVDHGIRPGSAAEASRVAANASLLGLPSRIMRAGPREPGNLQDWARRARYRCLAEAARDAGFDSVVTAHHMEDQAETFLMRLARGSGVHGLGAMRRTSVIEGVRVARPLLDVTRAQLASITSRSGLPIASDPSNGDRRFERVRMRGLGPALAAHGLSADRLAESAAHLARAAVAIDACVTTLLAAHFTVDPFGVVRGGLAAIAAAPEEIALRTLARIVQAAGGAQYPVGSEKLGALYRALAARDGETVIRRTLGGAVAESRAGALTFRREWGRSGPPVIRALGGTSLVWDRRFRVEVPDAPGELTIGPLGSLRGENSRSALRTTPALFSGEALLGIPDSLGDDRFGAPPFKATCLVAKRLGLPEDQAD